MTEEVIGKLSYPANDTEPEEPVYMVYTDKEPEPVHYVDSDAKGVRPNNFTWVENGLFATCSTPASPTYDNQYKWLIENNVSHLITLESWTPKLVMHHDKKLTNINYRVTKFSAPSLDVISEIFQLLDVENRDGKAVVVSCKNGDASSAVVACCYLLRKYRYEVIDAIEEARSMLAVGSGALPRPHYEHKVFEYHMQRCQDGFSNHWFGEGDVYNKHVQKGDSSRDMKYEPAVKDVKNLWKLK